MSPMQRDIELLSTAPGGISLIRRMILELGVRGSLVPQIRGETQFNFSGASRLTKPDEVERPLPSGWVCATFADICAIETDLVTPEQFLDEPQIGPDCIEKGTGRQIAARTVRGSGVRGPNYRFRAGQILYSKIRPSLSKVLFVDHDGLCSADVYPLRSRVFPRFQVLYMLSEPFLAQVRRAENRVKMPKLNQESLNAFVVAVPPLAEQHRIVAKVDELMALCDRLEARQQDAEAAHTQLVQVLLDRLTEARDAEEFQASWKRVAGQFKVLFTTESSVDLLSGAITELAVSGRLVPQSSADEPASVLVVRWAEAKRALSADTRRQTEIARDQLPRAPYDVPASWSWTHLDALFAISGGVTLGRKLDSREIVSVPYLRVANVQRGSLDLRIMKSVGVRADEVTKYRLQNGDLLVTEGGDWDKVGRTAVWSDELPLCLHQNHVFRVRRCSAELNLRWTELYLNSRAPRNYFAAASKQTTNLASINMTQLRSCPFPVPPIDEQRRIVDAVESLLGVCEQLRSRIEIARAKHAQLADSLLSHAVAT